MTGKPQLNREVNRRIILARIRREGEVSRADLAKITEIRPPTISAVMRELVDEGLVEERGAGATNGGRAPRLFAIRGSIPRALGFEINESRILAALCDLHGETCQEIATDFTPCSPVETIATLTSLRDDLLESAGISWSTVLGVGIAMPGLIRGDEGLVRISQPLDWHDVSFRAMCEREWNRTTYVVNDSLAGGMAAHFLGDAGGVKNLVYLNIRYLNASHGVLGLGCGIVLDGEPFHGEFGAAGEITTPIAHPLTHLSAPPSINTVSRFVELVANGDGDATLALQQSSDEVANLAIHVINFLEPGMLILGIDEPRLVELVVSRIRSRVRGAGLADATDRTQVVAADLGEFGLVRGAVVPALQEVFRLPRWS
jgi:predicted NBD/HSP70 family sugar kinase